MIHWIIDITVAFLLLGILKAFVEPLAEQLVNRFVMARIGKAYRYINPNAGSWLEKDKLTGAEVAEQIGIGLETAAPWLVPTEETVKPTRDLATKLKVAALDKFRDYAVRKLDKDYSLIENAKRING